MGTSIEQALRRAPNQDGEIEVRDTGGERCYCVPHWDKQGRAYILLNGRRAYVTGCLCLSEALDAYLFMVDDSGE